MRLRQFLNSSVAIAAPPRAIEAFLARVYQFPPNVVETAAKFVDP